MIVKKERNVIKARMTTIIKASLNKSDDHTNIDICKSGCKYYKISYYIKTILPKNHHSKIHDAIEIINVKNVFKDL